LAKAKVEIVEILFLDHECDSVDPNLPVSMNFCNKEEEEEK
jgi:hypothetical protein